MDFVREIVEIIKVKTTHELILSNSRVESIWVFKINPNPIYINDKQQMEHFLEMLIRAHLKDYKEVDEYAITLSSPNMPYKCMLPLKAKFCSIEGIIFSMQLYCYTAPNHYRDTFKFKIQIFPRPEYDSSQNDSSESEN
jgi:hypothetical protein